MNGRPGRDATFADGFDNPGNNLDFIRLVLAVAVIFSHSFPLGAAGEDLEPMMRLTGGQTTLGTVSVQSFFILSGFLITHSFTRSRSLAAYLGKRCRRIYPGFIACMLICALLVAPLAGATPAFQKLGPRLLHFVGATSILREFPYRNAFPSNPNGAINGSVWSISYEFAGYLLVAGLGACGLLGRRIAISVALGASLAVLATIGWLLDQSARGALHLALILDHLPLWGKVVLRAPLIPAFLAGMVFYLNRRRMPMNPAWAVACVCVLGLSCLRPGLWLVFFPLAGTYLLFWFGFNERFRLHNVARFGDFSYGTYLYAFPIQQLLVQHSGGRLDPFVLFACATPLSVLAAALSWHGVEKWFLSRGPAAAKGPSVAAAKAVLLR